MIDKVLIDIVFSPLSEFVKNSAEFFVLLSEYDSLWFTWLNKDDTLQNCCKITKLIDWNALFWNILSWLKIKAVNSKIQKLGENTTGLIKKILNSLIVHYVTRTKQWPFQTSMNFCPSRKWGLKSHEMAVPPLLRTVLFIPSTKKVIQF